MLPYSAQDVLDTMHSCENINAAMKSFLKREVRKGDTLEKFTKNFRSILLSNSTDRQVQFIEKHLPQYEPAFFALARYALFETVDKITSRVIEKHAEAFNATFDSDGETIDVTNRPEFERIAAEAIAMFRSDLQGADVPDSNFMLLVLITSLFDQAVVPEVVPLAAGSQPAADNSHA